MEVEIRPAPTPEERAALERALVELAVADSRSNGRGPWWHAGLEEALDREPPAREACGGRLATASAYSVSSNGWRSSHGTRP